jgi:hypothetical protein
MGAKTWMLVICDGNPREILKSKPVLDRAATLAFAKALYPSEKLSPLEDGTLMYTCPPDEELVIGAFPKLKVVAAKEFGIDYPSRLPASFLDLAARQSVYLHAMHSAVDWLAFAVWKDGQLKRSLSLSPDSGVLEDIGDRLPFELPFWSGQHPAIDPEEDDGGYPFVFHPLELGEAALLEFFGYQLEGMIDPSQLEPDDVTLMRFKRGKRWWKF